MKFLTLRFFNNTLKLFSIFKIENKLSIIVILVIFSTLLELIGIGLLIPIASLIFESDNIISNKLINILPTSLETKNSLHLFLIMFLLTFLIKNTILIFVEYYKANYFHKVFLSITNKFYYFYLNARLNFYFKKNSSKIIHIILSRIPEYIGSLQAFANLVSEIILTFGIVVLLLSVSSLYTIVVIFFLVCFVSVYLKFLKKKLILYGQTRDENQSNYVKHMNETLSFFRELNIFDLKKHFQVLENQISKKFVNAQKNITFLNSIGRNIFEIIAIICIFSFLIILNNKEISITNALPIIGIYMAGAIKILPSINRISNGIQNITVNFNVTETIIDEIISLEKNQLKLIEKDNNELEFNKHIKIENLYYDYEEAKYVLKNFNLTINKGECIAIVGKSGSGKSTLLEIICGFIEPQKGKILIDNKNLLDHRYEWMSMIGYVTQDTFILNDTLKNNIALFDLQKKNIDEDKVIESLKTINLFNFFNDQKKGINTILDEKGKTLSGGQKQRINIARNLYKDPKVIVFDEPTSALDQETSEEIIKELNKIKKFSTIIIVTHDKKIMNFCDRIVNLDEINVSD